MQYDRFSEFSVKTSSVDLTVMDLSFDDDKYVKLQLWDMAGGSNSNIHHPLFSITERFVNTNSVNYE